jgi:hypothetical protein
MSSEPSGRGDGRPDPGRGRRIRLRALPLTELVQETYRLHEVLVLCLTQRHARNRDRAMAGRPGAQGGSARATNRELDSSATQGSVHYEVR